MRWPDFEWWGYEEALEEARRQRKPIALFLTASWCSADQDWFPRVSGKGDQRDEQGLAEISQQFILARVDAERRPDVCRRYRPSDLPAALLLDPTGDVLLGSGSASYPRAARPCLANGPMSPNPIQIGERLPRSDLRAVLSTIENALLLSFDEVHGGFGAEPKRPESYALGYAITQFQRSGSQRWHEVFSLSLDGITRGLFDAASGGFHRRAGRRDWEEPETAKLLGVNAEVIRAYVRAYEATQRASYLDVASRALRFVLATLRGAAFHGSLAPGDQVDRTVYLPSNEEMIGTLCLAAQVTGETRYANLARQVQDYLLERMFDRERGFAHYDDGRPHLYGLLLDNAAGLVGLARAYAALFERDYLVAATQTADLILQMCRETAGLQGQVCRPPADVAFEDGALAAEGLVSVGRLTGSTRYCEAARCLAENLVANLAGQRVGTLGRFGSLIETLLEADPASAGADPRPWTTRTGRGSGP